LGGLAGVVSFWLLMSSFEGLGYAVPVRPSVIVPERWVGGARLLIFIIVLGIAASLVVPLALGAIPRLSFFHFLLALGITVPLWEILAARVYGDCFVIVNGREEVIRPIAVETINKVFGEMYEDKDMLRSSYKAGEDWQLIGHEREHLLALDPVYLVDMRRRNALEAALKVALKKVKPAGLNERAFWISFMMPLGFALVYGGIAFYLLRPLLVH
jgi:hypothetical protein